MTSTAVSTRFVRPFTNLSALVADEPRLHRRTNDRPRRQFAEIPADMPQDLAKLLRGIAITIQNGNFGHAGEQKFRQKRVNAWVTAKAATDKRYKTLDIWADAVEDVAILVSRDLKVETLVEATMRVLGKLKSMYPDRFDLAIGEFAMADVVDLDDLAKLL